MSNTSQWCLLINKIFIIFFVIIINTLKDDKSYKIQIYLIIINEFVIKIYFTFYLQVTLFD